jgi:hypothetical protein
MGVLLLLYIKAAKEMFIGFSKLGVGLHVRLQRFGKEWKHMETVEAQSSKLNMSDNNFRF